MNLEDVKHGQAVWYLYRIPGSGLTAQVRGDVVSVRNHRVTVKLDNGRTVSVSPKNLDETFGGGRHADPLR